MLAVVMAASLVAAAPLAASAVSGSMDIGGTHISDISVNERGGGWTWSPVTNTLTLTSLFTGKNIWIYCNPRDNIELVISGNITMNSNAEWIIKCDGSLNISGSNGQLTINADKTGIYTAGNISFSGGAVNISAATGVSADGDVTIKGNADLTIDSSGSGIIAGGNVTIDGGNIDVNAISNGISASGNVAIRGGSGYIKANGASGWAVKAVGSVSPGNITEVKGWDGADYTVPSVAAAISGYSTFVSASSPTEALRNIQLIPLINASVMPESEIFDKSGGEDITITLNCGSYKLLNIKTNNNNLLPERNYTVAGDENSNICEVTFKASYLRTLIPGSHKFILNMSGSTSPVFTITIVENSSITPTTATYEKNSGADIMVTFNRASNSLRNIKNGPYTLIPEKDYTALGTENSNIYMYNIKASYLDTLAAGSYKINFVMNTGVTPTLTIRVTDAGAVDTAISQTTATFDRGVGGDITVALNIGSYNLLSLQYGQYTLIQDEDYTAISSVANSLVTLTFKESWLNTLSESKNTITVNMSGGEPAAIIVTVTGTAPQPEPQDEPQDAPEAHFPFTDVAANMWYYYDVKIAWQTGLIDGRSPTAFYPNDNLTYAEAVKLAACMHQLYTIDAVTLENGSPWYQSYVDYAKANGIISRDYQWLTPATRAGYMEIFANALPPEALAVINNISDGSIPDVPMAHLQAGAIYKLYRAGILQGVDAAHNCNPGADIKRSEVSAVLTRMMHPEERINFNI